MHRTLIGLIASLAGPLSAGEFQLNVPLDCALGEDQPCYIQSYTDRTPGPDFQDYTCANLSYDGHKGTDFALRSHAEIAQNIPVLAAASGVVVGTRDGMPDKEFRAEDRAQIEGRDCGNGVVIRHEEGWETQYCHFKQGSVQVQKGQSVNSGAVLGSVGMSGVAAFPHLHLSVRRNGKVVDPFNPSSVVSCGSAPETDLWATALPYQAGGLVSAGFTSDVPSYFDVKSGAAKKDEILADSPALVFWGLMFGPRAGDILNLHIRGPDGKTVHNSRIEITKTQAQSFRAAGRKTHGARWFKKGTYTGTARLIRDGETISDIITATSVR